jgi:DNA-binding CsgD family transcriptional regulator
MVRYKKNTIIAFSLVLGWVLSFPYEGSVFFALAQQRGLNIWIANNHNMFIYALGLIASWILLKKSTVSKIIVLIAICFISPFFLFMTYAGTWEFLGFVFSFLSGIVLGSLARFLLANVHMKYRANSVAYILILGSLVATIVDVALYYFGQLPALIIAQSALLCALIIIIVEKKHINMAMFSYSKSFSLRSYWLFYVFIFIITINVGVMFSIIHSYYSTYTFLSTVYILIPYMLAIFLVSIRYIKTKQNSMFFGLTIWGVAFIIFTVFDKSLLTAVVVISLMFFACGIFDYFWWSVMAQNLEKMKNPTLFWGVGLATNAIGVGVGSLLGGVVFAKARSMQELAMFGLLIVVVSISMILPLNIRLSKLTSYSAFLIDIPKTIDRGKFEVMEAVKRTLSAREYEIFNYLVKEHTDSQICGALYIEKTTVKTHNKKIYKKLGVENRKELARKYIPYVD